MKNLRTLTLAATLALIGMAGGYAGVAQAQTGDLATPTAKPVAVQGLLLPAVQKVREGNDGVADLVTGAGAGKPGEANTLIGLLKPTDQTGTVGTKPTVQFPTDQVNGDGRADLVTGAGGGTQAGLSKVGTGTLVLSNANTYGGQTTVNQGVLNQKGSLQRLGSINDLFANSRGGDQAGAHGAGGGGGAGKVSLHDISVTKAGDGSVMPTDQVASADTDKKAGGKGGKVPLRDFNFTSKSDKTSQRTATDQIANPTNGGTQLPAVQAIREAARGSTGGAAGGGTAGGGQIAGGAKTMTMQNAARK